MLGLFDREVKEDQKPWFDEVFREYKWLSFYLPEIEFVKKIINQCQTKDDSIIYLARWLQAATGGNIPSNIDDANEFLQKYYEKYQELLKEKEWSCALLASVIEGIAPAYEKYSKPIKAKNWGSTFLIKAIQSDDEMKKKVQEVFTSRLHLATIEHLVLKKYFPSAFTRSPAPAHAASPNRP